MNSSPDFIVTYGLLEKYTGSSDSIVIPDGVSRIENKAFIGCRSIKEIFFPESVTDIGEDAIRVSKNTLLFFGNKPFDAIPAPCRGVNALKGFVAHYREYGVSEETARSYAEFFKANRYEIGIKNIFKDRSLFDFAVRYSVMSPDDAEGLLSGLPDNRFSEERAILLSYIGTHCDDDSLDILDRMLFEEFLPLQDAVGVWQFKDADDGGIELTKYIGSDLRIVTPTKIGEKSVTAVGEKAFRNCEKIQSVTISPGVKVIGALAFAWCTSLEEVIIPEGVERIEKNAFRDCRGLSRLTLPDSLKYIGSCAFFDCTRLHTVRAARSLVIGKDVFSTRSSVAVIRR